MINKKRIFENILLLAKIDVVFLQRTYLKKMELDFKIIKSAPVLAGFDALRKCSIVKNQIIERVVYSNTFSTHQAGKRI